MEKVKICLCVYLRSDCLKKNTFLAGKFSLGIFHSKYSVYTRSKVEGITNFFKCFTVYPLKKKNIYIYIGLNVPKKSKAVIVKTPEELQKSET